MEGRGPIPTKQCLRCSTAKPLTEFGPHIRARDGLQPYCKVCNREQKADWYAQRYKRAMVSSARSRAKVQGVPCTITEDDIDIPVFCPALGLKLEIAFAGEAKDNSPSLDKIVPELGYVPDNIVVISNLANTMKNKGTIEQLRDLADFYTELQRNQWRQKMKLTRRGRSASARTTASPSLSPLTTGKRTSERRPH